MKKNTLIVKDNTLINAKYTLTLVEKRIILLLVAKNRHQGLELNNNDYITIHASELVESFELDEKSVYRSLRSASDSLLGRQFSYKTTNKKGEQIIVRSNWLQSARYNDDAGEICVLLTKELIPFISHLKERFSSYFLEDVRKLTSVYAVRLYELIIQWRSTGKTPLFKLGDFKQKMGLEEEDYPRMDNFKKKVLDFAVDQINEHTDITVSYEQHKRGRSISGFSFAFKQKNKAKKLASAKPRRQNITKEEAANMAHAGESWSNLIKRLSSDYNITNL